MVCAVLVNLQQPLIKEVASTLLYQSRTVDPATAEPVATPHWSLVEEEHKDESETCTALSATEDNHENESSPRRSSTEADRKRCKLDPTGQPATKCSCEDKSTVRPYRSSTEGQHHDYIYSSTGDGPGP
eukprot:scpid92200/ scgid6366/ 